MKRDQKELDLRSAFPPMPEACHSALMNAARSVREEKPVKRASFRAVLIAALILIATTAIALAASQLGWVDFYKGYEDAKVPKAAQDILGATEERDYQVGPLTFTLTQTLSDGKLAMSATKARTTDGSKALLTPDGYLYDAVDAGDDMPLTCYQLQPRVTWLEAATQLKVPLYGVRAILEVSQEYAGEWAMEDALWAEDGSITYFSMPQLNPKTVKDSLPATLYLAVMEFDSATGEIKEKWEAREELILPVTGMLAEKTYALETPVNLGGLTLTGVRAEQYVTGVYLFATLTVPEKMDESAAIDAAYRLTFCDENGKPLPSGMNLSGGLNVDNWPTIVLEAMISADALPGSLMITDGTVVIVK